MPQQNKRRRPADTELHSAATFSDQASTVRPRPQEQAFELVSTSTRLTTSGAIDRRSTGIQKLIELKQHEPQFIFNYSIEQCPQNVQDLCVRLRKAAFHYKNIIPQELQEQIITNHPFEVPPDGIWSLNTTAPEKANQLYQRVEELYLRMTDLNGVHTGIWEAGCYGAIEAALRHFEGRLQGDDSLDFRNLTPLTCTSSSILNDLLPYDSTTQLRVKSTRVDLLIGYRSDQEPWKGCLRERKRHGLNPVPLTPLQGQGIELDFIGVIPVEVKNATGDSMDARYQLVLCASGMLQLRQMWATNSKKEAFSPEKPPIVIALSIVGHNWSYYIIFLGKPEPPITNTIQEPSNPLIQREFDLAPRIVLGPFMAGHTMGILPTFQLFHFLMVLREWVVKEWAPAAYEELSPAVPAVDPGTPTVAGQSERL